MNYINLYSEVLKQASIIDVVNYYGLKPVHNKCLCPFHNDNHPSLSIDPKKNIATCFSCQVTGNTISFVQKYEELVNHNKITTKEAIAKVVDICHLDIDVSKIKNDLYDNKFRVLARKYSESQKSLIELNNRLNRLFTYNLTALKGEALDYLHDRGIDDTSIKELSMGFAIKGQLLNLANSNNKNFPRTDLIKLGYLKQNDDGSLYETFQNRVMLPICDEKGNIVTFCGRTINDETPKYLHTSETELFHKNELLYNFHESKNLAYNNELILVEGYMDVQGAKKLGFQNVAALMGTNISDEHLKLIRRNHSTITLALDNDEAGLKAMVNQIPKLLNQGFRVYVIDISQLGEYKDFGDLGNSNLKYMDIQKYKTSAFTFILNKKYFKNKDFSVETISSVYKELKKDKLINNTYDESLFKEYLLNMTDYSKNELEEIMYPKKIIEKESIMDNFATKAMTNYLFSEVKNQANMKNDTVLSSYFDMNSNVIEQDLVELFNLNPDLYLDKESSTLKSELLLSNFLNENKEYSDYESLNRFKYSNVFDKTYIKNVNGGVRIRLNDTQKKLVIKQFEDTLSDEVKLSLEEVEELYIINSIDDIDGILSYNSSTLELLKDHIKDKMVINDGNMGFFKFGNLFLDADKDFIDNRFKGKTGNYKTILFYNNLDNALNLTKDNVISNDKSELEQVLKEEQPTNEINEHQQDYKFSINKVLLVPELETETHYFVRIPYTDAECEWTSNEDLFYTSLKQGKTYPIYNKNGEFLYEKPFEKLKNNWEDKTKNNVNLDARTNSPSIKKEDNLVYDNSYISRYKEPICKVYKSKIFLETEKGFYIRTENPNTLLFALKKICNWNSDKSYLIVSPHKGKFINSGISKYSLDGHKKEYQGKISYKDIEKYIKIFYPSNFKKKDLLTLEIPKEKCEFNSNFIKVPLVINNINGFIEVNFVKSKINEKSVILEFSNNEQIGFYNKNGEFINLYDSNKICDSYKEMILDNKIIKFPTNEFNRELEKEAA